MHYLLSLYLFTPTALVIMWSLWCNYIRPKWNSPPPLSLSWLHLAWHKLLLPLCARSPILSSNCFIGPLHSEERDGGRENKGRGSFHLHILHQKTHSSPVFLSKPPSASPPSHLNSYLNTKQRLWIINSEEYQQRGEQNYLWLLYLVGRGEAFFAKSLPLGLCVYNISPQIRPAFLKLVPSRIVCPFSTTEMEMQQVSRCLSEQTHSLPCCLSVVQSHTIWGRRLLGWSPQNKPFRFRRPICTPVWFVSVCGTFLIMSFLFMDRTFRKNIGVYTLKM